MGLSVRATGVKKESVASHVAIADAAVIIGGCAIRAIKSSVVASVPAAGK
jgi:hypothetical protein